MRGFAVPWLVGLRYALSTGAGALVSFISRVSMLGLVLGVALLIVVLSVMNGFERELREKILALMPHVAVQPLQPLQDWQGLQRAVEAHPKVVAAAPYVDLQGLLMARGRAVPALLHGVDVNAEQRVSPIARYLEQGSFHDLREHSLMLSRILANRLGIGVGERLMLLVPDVNAEGRVMPRMQQVEVAALFDTGTEVDNLLAIVDLGLASRLRGSPGSILGMRFQVRDLFEAPRVEREVVSGLGIETYSINWTQTHGNLFDAIRLSRNLVAILLFLIVAVAVFNIVSTLFLIVKEKEGDIAILRTLGAGPVTIMGVFVVQGSLIGLAGAMLGGLIGSLLSLMVTDVVSWLESLLSLRFLDAGVYPVSYLPSELLWHDVFGVCTVALAMSFAATIYPAWRASRLAPAEVLRYE